MFEIFQPQNEQGWFQLLAQELKGKDPAILNGRWEKKIEYRPFYLLNNAQKNLGEPLRSFPEHYEVGSFYNCEDLLSCPQLLDYALKNDVQFVGVDVYSSSNFAQVFYSTFLPLSTTYPNTLFYYQVPCLETVKKIAPLLVQENASSKQHILSYEWVTPLIQNKAWASLENWQPTIENLLSNPLNINYVESINLYAFDAYGIFSYQELGFFQYYLNHLLLPRKSIPHSKIYVIIPLSLNFNLQIAKVRALRKIWQEFVASYFLSSVELYLIGRTSLFYWSRLLEENNLIRNTISVMAGVLGGCNTVAAPPHTFEKNNSKRIHADRWARNIQHLLIHESGLTKVKDPLAGCYLIENLTHQIIDSAQEWNKQFEEKGGIFTQEGLEFLLNELLQAKQHRVNLALSKEVPIIGSNLYRVPQDPPLKELTTSEIETMLPTLQRIAELFE